MSKIYIYGMSVSRSYLIGKIEGYADVIQEHTLKIVTAQQNGNIKFVDKWINDLSRAIYNISKYTIGNKGKRLDSDAYRQYMFGNHFGIDKIDMKHLLEDFHDDYIEYANFTIDNTMIDTLYSVVNEMKSIVPDMIASHKSTEGIPIPEIRKVLRSIFLKYINFKIGRENWGVD